MAIPWLFVIQLLCLLPFWYYCFRHPAWRQGWYTKLCLFLLPFAFGCFLLWLDIHFLPLSALQQWHSLFCFFSICTALLLLPQWYKFMWLALFTIPVKDVPESTKLLFTVLFSIIMVWTIIFFFAIYFLWFDHLSGYTQGLRSSFLNDQPVLLDFPTAFYFSFSCYFSLGFGDYFPYGIWFYFFVFLECFIALLNNGIILIYAYNFLFRTNT